ncbi:hypothetical protein D3C74_434050 [compost metagenome]
MFRLESGVKAPYLGNGPCLHARHRLALRESDSRRVGLHLGPQSLGGKLGQGAALPGAIIALGELWCKQQFWRVLLRLDNVLGCLLAAFQRA